MAQAMRRLSKEPASSSQRSLHSKSMRRPSISIFTTMRPRRALWRHRRVRAVAALRRAGPEGRSSIRSSPAPPLDAVPGIAPGAIQVAVFEMQKMFQIKRNLFVYRAVTPGHGPLETPLALAADAILA